MFHRECETERGYALEGEENRFSYCSKHLSDRQRGSDSAWACWWYRSWGKSSSSLFNILISPSLPHHASPLHFIHSEGNTPSLSSGRTLLFTQAPPHLSLSCSLCIKLLTLLLSNGKEKFFYGTLTVRFLIVWHIQYSRHFYKWSAQL